MPHLDQLSLLLMLLTVIAVFDILTLDVFVLTVLGVATNMLGD